MRLHRLAVPTGQLRQTADDSNGRYSPEVITTIYRNFYVDDVLKSVPTTDQAIWLAEQLTKLLREGGFHLTKFTSNTRQVLEALPQDKRANPSINLDLNQLPVGRALGLHWDAASDTFQFKVVPTNKPPTKRGILSTVSSLYDPLGFLGPFILPVKIILQELWRIAVQWDDPIPEPLLTRWNKWIESLPLVANIKISRCFKSFSLRVIRDVQMHYFSDASNHGYAAVGYLRLVDDTGKIHCAFVMGKTRNSPLRQWSIPRLELQAALVASRLHLLLREELDTPLHGVTFWSDSLTTLQYITNEKKRFKPFVANRVNEIRKASTPQQWRHVPTSLNPADDASRGLDLRALKSNCRWLTGPSFLLEPEDQWPIKRIGNIPEDDNEVQVQSTVMMIDRGSSLDQLLRRCSSWPRLLTLVAWLLRFINHIQNKGTEKGRISLSKMRNSSEALRTVFAEVVIILNSRPLTPCSDDPNDLEPLTPNHLLLQRKHLALHPGLFVHEDLYGRKQWRRAQFLADCFWKRWIKEYLPTLQQRQKWVREKGSLKVKDLVLIVDEKSPRGRWLFGRVLKIFPGDDQRLRVAEVKTKSSTLIRLSQKKFLLFMFSLLFLFLCMYIFNRFFSLS